MRSWEWTVASVAEMRDMETEHQEGEFEGKSNFVVVNVSTKILYSIYI